MSIQVFYPKCLIYAPEPWGVRSITFLLHVRKPRSKKGNLAKSTKSVNDVIFLAAVLQGPSCRCSGFSAVSPALDSTSVYQFYPEILLGDKHILCQLLLDLQVDQDQRSPSLLISQQCSCFAKSKSEVWKNNFLFQGKG